MELPGEAISFFSLSYERCAKHSFNNLEVKTKGLLRLVDVKYRFSVSVSSVLDGDAVRWRLAGLPRRHLVLLVVSPAFATSKQRVRVSS